MAHRRGRGRALTQGTSSVGLFDLLDTGDEAMRVLLASRLPRLLAAVAVGLALGASGALLQSISRNPLASPDTLAFSSGAYLAVVAGAALGVNLPALPSGGLAFLGGLAAAGGWSWPCRRAGAAAPPG